MREGLRKKDLVKQCAFCKQGVGHGMPFQLTVAHLRCDKHLLDCKAIQRAQGLEMMLNPALATLMGPDEPLTIKLPASLDILICESCWHEHLECLDPLAHGEEATK